LKAGVGEGYEKRRKMPNPGGQAGAEAELLENKCMGKSYAKIQAKATKFFSMRWGF
jgi:hypothetical protein